MYNGAWCARTNTMPREEWKDKCALGWDNCQNDSECLTEGDNMYKCICFKLASLQITRRPHRLRGSGYCVASIPLAAPAGVIMLPYNIDILSKSAWSTKKNSTLPSQ